MAVTQIPIKQDFSESVDYIIPQFPIYIRKGLLSNYPYYRAVSHWHEDIEFIYVLSGEMDYEVNGEIFSIHEKEGIIINSRNFHYGFSESKTECEFICILIHPTLFSTNTYIHEKYVLPFTECTSLPYILLSSQSWHQDIAANLIALLQLEPTSELFYLNCQQYAISLFKTLYAHNKESLHQELSSSDKALVQLRKMVHYIQKNYAETLTLENIACAGDMGKTRCCSLFKTYMHTTPIDYLLAYRMSQSVNLLLETNLSITEIAYAVGFRDSSYYTKYFRNYYGKTPREMRILSKS